MIFPSLLVYVVPRMARMSPSLRASNEGLPRPRVARAQGTNRAIPPLLADFFSILLGLLRFFVSINVPNKDCASIVIHESFDPIPDMGRSIDSSIFVMRHATFDATDFLKHIGPTLDCRHLSF